MKKELFPIAICLLLIANCQFANAHDGHKHEEEKKSQPQAGKRYFTVSSVSDVFEIVLRYEPVEKGHPFQMKLFVSDFETNKAIDSATIEITCAENDKLKFSVKQTEKGMYSIQGAFPENKSYTLIANVSAGDKADLMTIEGIEVGKKLPLEEKSAVFISVTDTLLHSVVAFVSGILLMLLLFRKKIFSRKATGLVILFCFASVFVYPPSQVIAHEGHDHGQTNNVKPVMTDEAQILKESQFLFDILTAFTTNSNSYSTLKLYGKVMPSVNGAAQIVSPQNGTIVSLNAGIGEKVGKGQILAVVEQALSAPEQVQLSTEKANAAAEFETAKKELDRLKSIQDIIAKKDLLQAEIRFKTAEANLKIYQNLSSNNSKLIALKSPLDGVVDNFNLSIGQQVVQHEPLFTVYDIRKVKIEAQVFDRDLDKVKTGAGFLVECVQENHRTEKAKFIAINRAVNPVNQSSLLILELDNPSGDFRPGKFVNVSVVMKSGKEQLVVPSSAVSEINGKPAVFVHTSPEIFRIKYIQPGESNSESTVVLKGIEENERVVVSGTYQVKSIYLNQ